MNKLLFFFVIMAALHVVADNVADKPNLAGKRISEDDAIYITKHMVRKHALWPVLKRKYIANILVEQKGEFSNVRIFYAGNGPPCYADNWIVTKIDQDGKIGVQLAGVFCAQ